MNRILIVSGGGDYTDPWHPFVATSACLEFALSAPGREITMTTDVAASLSDLGGVDEWDLVVLNLGSGEQPQPTDAACVSGLARWVESGGALLVMHSTSTAFPLEPEGESILGGRWVRGTSMHPEQGFASVELAPVRHAVTAGLKDFTVFDERYSHLRMSPEVTVLATHEHEGTTHPLVWAREEHGSRLVYDALGHDARSYTSDPHRRLLANAARWLLADTEAPA